MPDRYFGPHPSPGFRQQVSAYGQAPLVYCYSGALVATHHFSAGAVSRAGKVSSVWMSVGSAGVDASNTLKVEGDVKINGTTCLTTKPVIQKGATSAHKTTIASGELITQAVIDTTANSVSEGDSITGVFTLTRTATPTTEITNPCICVEFEPEF